MGCKLIDMLNPELTLPLPSAFALRGIAVVPVRFSVSVIEYTRAHFNLAVGGYHSLLSDVQIPFS